MKPRVLLSVFVCIFCFAAAAFAQKAEPSIAPTDERQIVEILLKEKFATSSADETVYVSTKNLSEALRKNFPAFKDRKVQLVANENSKEETCAYEFGKFEFIDRFVSVTFGDCRDGLAYDFKKDGETWKSVGLTVTKPLLY